MKTTRTGKAAADPAKTLVYIDKNFEGHLMSLQGYLKVDNLITARHRCDEVARRLKSEIETLGGRASILDYGDLPFVYGAIDAGAKRTLVIYRNYDIVPAEGADWSAAPFSGKVRRVEGLGDCIVSRGVCDPKGPLVGTLRAVESILKAEGSLPVNLVFLLEGDEQLGSPSLARFVRERRVELKAADGVLYPKFCQGRSGDPVLPLGVKGVLLLDLICSGGAWGGPTRMSIHSGNAAWVASPAWRMVKALSTLVDDAERILVDGFYDGVVQVINADRAAADRGGAGRGDAAVRKGGALEDQYEYLRRNHVLRFKMDLPPADLGRKYLESPTFNIGNLLIHSTRPWSRLLLPCEVRAQVDIRLVPDQEPDAVVDAIRRHLKKRGYGDIEVITRLAYRPWSIDEDHPLVGAARRVYAAFGKEPEIQASTGTSHSFSLFDEVGLPLVVAGLGTGGRAFHSSEYASIAGIKEFEKSVVRFLHEFAVQESGQERN
jgi:acetylornithine deacetylase/succinyl-diaminopimelate desuccinylase-like protein